MEDLTKARELLPDEIEAMRKQLKQAGILLDEIIKSRKQSLLKGQGLTDSLSSTPD